MRLPRIKSRKQHIRLWFEFYKLCLSDPQFTKNLKQSKDFYEPWGDVRNVLFDEWWKTHKRLFGETSVKEISQVSKYENVINVAIPLNLSISETIKDVKDLVEKRQKERFAELGITDTTSKSMKPHFGQYELTKGVEIRGRTLHEIQIMYSIWIDMGKPPVNTAYCQEVVSRLRNRPRSKWIPYLLQIEPEPDRKGNLRYDEGQLRQVRRYLKKGEQVCKSVSLGQFPGKNRLS
jgi:hypothetical protein